MSKIYTLLIIALALFVFMDTPAFAGGGNPNCHTNSCLKKEATSKKNAGPDNHVPNILSHTNYTPNAKSMFSFIKLAMKAGSTMAARFIPYAIGLASLLGAIAFIWLGIMIMLSQADIWHMGIRPLFSLIMTIGFTFWFLFDYQFITTSIIDGFTFAANILNGIGGNSASNSTIASVGQSLINDIIHMADLLADLREKTNFTGDWFGSMLVHLIDNLFALVVDGAVIGISMAISIVIYILFIIIYMVYQIVAAIAIAVGPVFIPFMILPATRSFFEGWVKMLIMSGMYLFSSSVIVGLCGTVMVTMVKSMHVTNNGAAMAMNMGNFIELIIIQVVCIFALLKTHEFAHAIGGSVSIGGINPGGLVTKAAKAAAGGK